MLLNTIGRPNALNSIGIRLFRSQDHATEIGHVTDPGHFANVMIDNTLPTVAINKILHDGAAVTTCEIVNSGSHNFSFDIAAKAERHLESWHLVSYWGDNASKAVASDDYSHHVSATRLWTGVDHDIVPSAPWDASVPGDPTSTRCAHSFWLTARDRVINGWWRIHDPVSYQKSITVWL